MDRHLTPAPIVRDVFAAGQGTIAAIDTREIGMAVVTLGGGRRLPTDTIDHTVGFDRLLGLGATDRTAACRSPASTPATKPRRPRPKPASSPPTASATTAPMHPLIADRIDP